MLVDVRHLPRVDGTSVLGWLAPARSTAEARDRLAHLRSDRHLSDTFGKRLEEAIVNKSIPATPVEQEATYQGALEAGRREGRRLELLALAREVRGADAVRSFEEIDDVLELRGRVAALLRGGEGD